MRENWVPRLRSWMRQEGISQEELARRLGCTRGAVGHYLSGRRHPGLPLMERLAEIMGVHPAWLIWGPASVHAGVAETPAGYESTPAAATVPLLDAPQGKVLGWIDLRPLSRRCYALRANETQSPRLYQDDLLILDPEARPEAGDEVLVQFTEGSPQLLQLVSMREGRLAFADPQETSRRRILSPEGVRYMHLLVAIVRRGTLPEERP